MEPLSAFALACGVIQVVDSSLKVVVKCREIYKDGASSENKEIDSMARRLKSLTADLKLPDTVQSPGSPLSLYNDNEELQQLARQCSETAGELISKLDKLSIRGTPKKRDVLWKAIKAIWEKNTIEGIQRRLEAHCGTLNTSILKNLRFVRLRAVLKR